MIVEVVKKTQTGSFKRGSFVDVSSYIPQITDTETFLSMFIHTKDALKFHLDNKTLENYSGDVIFNYLWIDVDSKDLQKACEFTHNLIDNINTVYGVEKNSLVIYFSGSKGFHIGIDAKLFNKKFYISKNIPKICKMLAAVIVGINPDDSEAIKLSPVDFGIYYTVSILRAPLSINTKSGCYKIRLDPQLIEDEDVGEIISKAKIADYDKPKLGSLMPNEKLEKLFDDIERLVVAETVEPSSIILGSGNVSNIFERSTKTVFYIPRDGERATALYKMAYRLFQQKDLLVDEVRDMMRIVFDATNYRSSETNSDLLKIKQLRDLLNSAYRRTRASHGKEINVVSFESMAQTAMQEIANKRNLPTGFPDYDKVLGGGLVMGNFYPLIGKYGTKKSILLQDMALHNCINMGSNILYCNLEMSGTQLFRRGVSKAMSSNFYDEVLNGSITSSNIKAFEEKVAGLLSNRLFVINETGISIEQLDATVLSVENKTGKKIHGLFIDSFSGLDQPGSEYDANVKISIALKELAKKRNLAIVLICHTSQAATHHDRDTSKFVRGGGKMADNSDGYFCTSLCIDINTSNIYNRDYKYIKELLYLRYVDKRETGDIVDKVIYLDNNLNLTPLVEPASNYEVKSA